MLERNFTSVVTHTIKAYGGWAYKIPDSGYDTKPFDITAIYKGQPLALELKWLTSPKAFNFTRLENHQIANLLEAWKAGAWAALVIGVDYGRSDKRIFTFANSQLPMIDMRKKQGQSILKKEFNSLPFIPLKNRLFDLEEFLSTDK